MSITLSESELIALYWWPFPPPKGYTYEIEALRHWVTETMVVAAERSLPVDERLRWVALATGATINRAVALQQAADTVGDAGETVHAANRSAIGRFVEGLVASPPVCEPVPFRPVPILVGWLPPPFGPFPTPLPPPPPPPPLNWGSDEMLSGVDLLGVGTRFQAAAVALEPGTLREEFASAAARLFEVGQARLYRASR
jgi:hypothetical protein